MADDAASFRTEMLSMSSGLMSLMATPVMPSTTTSGAALFNVPWPRTNRLCASYPGVLPPELVTVRPAASPARALVALVIGRSARVEELMDDTDPVRSTFRWVE